MSGFSNRADESEKAALVSASPSEPAEVGTSDTLPGSKIDELLERIAHPTLPAPQNPAFFGLEPAAPALRTARIERIKDDGQIELRMRGSAPMQCAVLDEGVQQELIEAAMRDGQPVLVEVMGGHPPVIVGVLQTRLPEKVELKGKDIVIDAERELIIRSGNAAMRMRADGEIEMVGSRILTLSRGLFRIVGKMLKLN